MSSKLCSVPFQSFLIDRDSNTRISYFLRFIFMMLIKKKERITDNRLLEFPFTRYRSNFNLTRYFSFIVLKLEFYLRRNSKEGNSEERKNQKKIKDHYCTFTF